MSDSRYCKKCGFAGEHDIANEISGAQWVLLVFFFCCFILPGAVYALYLWAFGGSNSFWVCPQCGARLASIPVSSPIARAEMAERGITLPPPVQYEYPVLKAAGKLFGSFRRRA
jgi:hypothetical protein